MMHLFANFRVDIDRFLEISFDVQMRNRTL